MTEQEMILEKMKHVIAGAAQFEEEEFRLILEGLVSKGGKEAEFLMVSYITAPTVPENVRANVIRCTGYLRSPVYLVPLKKIIDQEPRLGLKKAAVIALSKFNNQRALNILNAALQSIQNPYLLSTINEQISYIKKNNPILALLPKFLKGDKDKKSFIVTIDILKKILTAEDATIFANYLRSDDVAIRCGSFEILCATAERTMQTHILDFFYQRLQPTPQQTEEHKLPPVTEEEAYSLATHVKVFFLRFPALILTQLRRLSTLYAHVTDDRIKKIIISILCHSRAPQALTFIKDIYEQSDPQFKEIIIEESAGNEQAVEFLFEKYQSGQALKEKVVRALLNSQKGFAYFSAHFLEYEGEVQEMIVKNLPETIKPQMINFIKTIFQANHSTVKAMVLKRVRDNYLFSFQELLFAPERLDALLELENHYLDTVSRLFPVTTVKMLLEKIATAEMEIGKIKRYLQRVVDISRQEIMIGIKDNNLLEILVLKIIGTSNQELSDLLLGFLESIKTLDRVTFKNLSDAANLYSMQRGSNIIEEEHNALARIKENMQNINEDIRKIETLDKEVKAILSKAVPDLNQLRRTLETYHLGSAFRIRQLIQMIAEYFQSADEKTIPMWREFFKGFPLLMLMVRETRAPLGKQEDGTPEESIYDKLRVVLRFEEKHLSALFKDQFKELLPEFKVVIDPLQLENTDILFCDGQALRNYMSSSTLHTKRIFVVLENRNEFINFKAINPKSFLRPVSVYRAVKMILQEMYLIKP